MANADGNFDASDLSDWAERTDGAEPGVSLDGLDEPLPGSEETEEDGEGVEGGDPCEALRAVAKAIDRLEAVELSEGADEKLTKRLDDLRDELEDLSKEASELADDVEKDEEDRKDEEPEDETEEEEEAEPEDEEPDADDEEEAEED